MIPVLEQQPRPFFAFLITLGLHHPFEDFPEQHKVLDVGTLKDTPLGNYLHAMHYFDASLARLMAGLEAYGLLRETAVAIYGDHEAGLPIDAAMLRLLGIGAWDPSITTRLRRVPFLVLVPGGEPRGEVGVVGGHVDIAPSLLYLLGIERPRGFLGSALAPGRSAIAVLPDGSATDGRRLFVASGPDIPSDGACFAFPAGAALPLTECVVLRTRAAEEVEASHLVVQHDLVPELEGRALPAPLKATARANQEGAGSETSPPDRYRSGPSCW